MSKYDASSIEVLEGLSAVRLRPEMYIGTRDIQGLSHLVFELLDNAMDEFEAGYGKEIRINFENGMCTLEDKGRGIPTDIHKESGKSALEIVLTTLHSGAKFDNEIYTTSSGLHGVGVSVVNALSDRLDVTVNHNGTKTTQSFERGIPTSETITKKIKDKKISGTSISFIPDGSIFTTVEFDIEIIEKRCKELIYLNPTLSIYLQNKKVDNTFIEDLIKGENQVIPFINLTSEISFGWTSSYNETIISFINNIHMRDGGTHVRGFKKGLQDVLKEVIQSKKDFTWDDIGEGLVVVLNLKIKNPQFEGQTKTRLGNKEIANQVEIEVKTNLTAYLNSNKSLVKLLKNKVLLSVKAREASIRAREHVRLKSQVDDISLAGKLADCQCKDPNVRELFLVEGQSAGGSAKQGRDRYFQAILPLKGKILNVEKASFSAMMKNEEIKQIIASIGTGIGKSFDLSKLQYSKIIMLFDSDVDGAHISTLFLTLMFRQFPQLLMNGNIYKACPPLYGIKIGNKIIQYVQDEKELKKVKIPKGGFLQRYKGLGELNPDQLAYTALNPSTRLLKRVIVEDLVKTDQIFDILMGDNIQARKEYIEQYLKGVNAEKEFKHLQL